MPEPPSGPRYRRPPAPPPRDRPSHRSAIWLQTLGVIALYGVAVCLVHAWWLVEIVPYPALSIVLAFTGVQTVAIGLILGGLVIRKAWESARERRLERVRPVIRSRVADHLAGGDELPALRELLDRDPVAVEEVALDLLASISGTELERLSELLDELGLVDRWIRTYRRADPGVRRRIVGRFGRMAAGWGNGLLRGALADSDEAVRIEAARALIRSGSPADVERVFAFAIDEPLLVRAVLIEDLRPYAMSLGEQAIPRILSSSRPERIEVTLEMIEAWQKSVSTPGLGTLLRHPRAGVRARSIRALPYVAAEMDVEREVVSAFEDDAPEVRIACASVAGRLGMERAVPALLEQLEDDDRHVAVAAAHALGEVGPEGWSALEGAVRRLRGVPAGAALEALEQVRTNRLHLARV